MSDSRRFVHDLKNQLGVIIGFSSLLEELTPEDPRRADIDEIRKAGEAAMTLVGDWSAAPREEEHQQ